LAATFDEDEPTRSGTKVSAWKHIGTRNKEFLLEAWLARSGSIIHTIYGRECPSNDLVVNFF
jgi:hypothetical protein